MPVIYAFSDGPKTPDKASAVESVRAMLREIDWCEVILCERTENLGLGRSILAGVTQVLETHDSVIVFEDDLVCVPGTYQYLSTALGRYQNDGRVMSVTGWTHPRVTPSNVRDLPYFDGRAECWVWGTWSRAWQGMDVDARTLMDQCAARGIDIHKYGADLVTMAQAELEKNIWAVRLLYLHILKGCLCLRPPWSMVEHIGFDADATNASEEWWLRNATLKPVPKIPAQWPEAVENPDCARLHRTVCGDAPAPISHYQSLPRSIASRVFRRITGR